MSTPAKKKYQVNRHFHFNGKVYSRLDQPEFTDQEAREILANQNPKPDGGQVKPVIEALPEAPKAAKA